MASSPVNRKAVDVHLLKDGRVFLQPYSTAENGHEIFDGLPEVVASIDDPVVVGMALQAALDRSNARVLPAVDYRATPPDTEFLKWVGARSFAVYARGVRSVSVTTTPQSPADTVTIQSEQNQGARGGFVPIDGTEFELSYSSPEELGRAVQEAMEKAI